MPLNENDRLEFTALLAEVVKPLSIEISEQKDALDAHSSSTAASEVRRIEADERHSEILSGIERSQRVIEDTQLKYSTVFETEIKGIRSDVKMLYENQRDLHEDVGVLKGDAASLKKQSSEHYDASKSLEHETSILRKQQDKMIKPTSDIKKEIQIKNKISQILDSNNFKYVALLIALMIAGIFGWDAVGITQGIFK